MLVDRAGAPRGVSVAPTPFGRVAAGVEMGVSDLESTLGTVIAGLGRDVERVVAAGVAGMAESGAPFVSGRPVGPILAWFDGRGEQTVARLTAAFGDGLARRIGQRVRNVSSVAKLGWLLDHGVRAPERWLGVPETCLFLLTGAEATEASFAARTGAFDIAERVYMPEVTAVLGVRPDVFADVRPAGEVMGRVSAAASVWYGLPAGIPVTLAGHDHLAAAEAVSGDDADLLNSVGTAETLVRRSPSLPDVGRALGLGLAVTVRPGGVGWVVLASATRSGLVLDSLAADLGLPFEELDVLAETAIAATTAAGTGGVHARPAAHGLRRALIPGVDVPDGPPGEVWAAALAALAARTAAAASRVAALLGPAPRMIVFGGGSRSRPWMAAKAALAPEGTTVFRAAAPEVTAHGAALAAGVAAGWWPRPSAGPGLVLEPASAAGRGLR